MKIARLTDYAFLILTALRAQAQLSATQLAQSTSLPEPTVAKVLKTLTHAGLVHSLRGAQGGYKLAQPAETISLVMVIEAMEGPIALTNCTQGGDYECCCTTICGHKEGWHGVNAIIHKALSGVTLNELSGVAS